MTIYYLMSFLFFNVFHFQFSKKWIFSSLSLYDSSKNTWKIKWMSRIVLNNCNMYVLNSINLMISENFQNLYFSFFNNIIEWMFLTLNRPATRIICMGCWLRTLYLSEEPRISHFLLVNSAQQTCWCQID